MDVALEGLSAASATLAAAEDAIVTAQKTLAQRLLDMELERVNEYRRGLR